MLQLAKHTKRTKGNIATTYEAHYGEYLLIKAVPFVLCQSAPPPLSAELKELYKDTTGNILVASGVVAYFGPFTVQFRDQLLGDWCGKCEQENIRVSNNVSLNSVLGKPPLIPILKATAAGKGVVGFLYLIRDEEL